MTLEAARFGLDAIQLLGLLLVGLYAWQGRRHAATVHGLSDLSIRMTVAESRLEAMPSAEAVHDLALRLSELSGDVKAVSARLDGVDGSLKGLQATSARLENYLLTQGR